MLAGAVLFADGRDKEGSGHDTTAAVPSMTELLLSDPVLLIGMLLPFLIIGGVLWYRLRAWRRVNALAARNEQRYDQTRDGFAAMWREAAARTERMIALLTEIATSSPG